MELKENVTYNCESAGLPIRLQLLHLLLLLYYTATAITLDNNGKIVLRKTNNCPVDISVGKQLTK